MKICKYTCLQCYKVVKIAMAESTKERDVEICPWCGGSMALQIPEKKEVRK
jgi:rRNA maturation endonuclease Nob1